MLVDFHMHSIYSDGVKSPEELLRLALECKLSMMALTDHDEIDGIKALRAAQKQLDPEKTIKIINGCEFSADYKDKSIHILGYRFDETNQELKDFIQYFKAKREERIDEIIKRCNNAGYVISKDDLLKKFPKTQAYGRPHIGQLLIDGGYAKDINEVFKGILRKDSPCYVPKVKVAVPHIIDIIHKAGGLAVMAHPKLVTSDEYVVEMLAYDFDGMEVYHTKHNDDDVKRYKALAKEHNLFITGGSDYHGIPGKGSSGTGKSHRALVVAHENNIECIIDDGILIHDNKIVAGFSAKKESSRLKAVRRAIFQDEVQVKSVREQLDKINPNKLMIIGTSDNMVKKITKALGLQDPDRYIRIEDVATPKEIEKAQHARLKEGKHIIPVPTMELKPHFRGYLIDPIKTMWRRRTLKKQDQDTLGQIGSEGFERSVVRPAFSYYGRLTFDDDVIIKLIRNGLKKVVGVDESSVISFKKSDKGQNGLVVDMAVVIEHGYPVKALMQQVQKSVRNEIEYITGMSIERMSIKVKNIIETKRKIVKV